MRQGKAVYVGISNYNAELTKQCAEILAPEGVPLTINQPNYSLLDRWIEPELLAANSDTGAGMIVLFPLGAGLSERQVPERLA